MTGGAHRAPRIPARFWHGWGDRAAALRHVPALLRLVWTSGRGVVAGAWACRIAGALIPAAMLAVSKRIFDAVQVVSAGGGLPPEFWGLVAAEGALALLGGLLGRATGFLDGLLADRFTRHISLRLMAHGASLDLMTYESPAFQDTLERARQQATDRVAMVHAIGSVAQQLIVFASLSLTLLYFSPWLLLALVLGVVPAFIGESHYAFLGYSLGLRQTPARRRLDYLRTLGTSKDSAKELKLFHLGGFVTREYERVSNELYGENLALSRRHLFAGAWLSTISTGSYYAAYAYVVYQTVQGQLTWGTLQLLAGSIAGATASVQSIFSTVSNIADQALFLTDLVAFFDVTPGIAAAPSRCLPAPRPIRDGVLFERVSFAYPDSARPILNGLDFRFSCGERVALVGENGEGKTTLVKLLTRLYDPTAGRILLDGVDLRDYDVDDLHRIIGVTFQDFVRYEMTARENIGVGLLDAAGDQARIEHAARMSLADEVIDRLPHRYDQLLGRRFEGGQDLSGGEWQRLALARAYMRDAQLLILDEPTAALDARAEADVFDRFADLAAGKMALLISHRFSTVRMADRIVVLAGGRIHEEGTHDDLMARGGRYAELFELQAASYR